MDHRLARYQYGNLWCYFTILYNLVMFDFFQFFILQVFESVINWTKFDLETRRPYLLQTLKLVKYEYLATVSRIE